MTFSFRAAFLSCLWLSSIPAIADPPPKAFELYPATNGAVPVPYAKPAPPFPTAGKLWRFDPGSKVVLKIDAAQVVRPVNPYQFGNNLAVWEGKKWVNDPAFVELAKESGIKFWRWPGGSTADSYHWDGNYDRYPKGGDHDPASKNAAWAISSDDFIGFCRATGSEAIVTVNYAASRYVDVSFAADLAARWVKYFNVDHQFKVRYWEIGNESYGRWETGNTLPGKATLTGDLYGNDWSAIADAMRKVDRDILIGAVAFVNKGEGKKVTDPYWTKDMLQPLAGKADFLVLHQYFTWATGHGDFAPPSNEAVFGNLSSLADDKSALDGIIGNFAPDEKGLPVALTEFNMTNPAVSGSIQLINGLFTAEVLGEGLKDGYAAADYWAWKEGYHPKTMGDPGMLSSGDPAVADGTPRPSYYAYALFSRAFGDHLVSADSSESTVKVYASKFAGGELGLVIVNENETNRTVTFDLKGFIPKGKLAGWVLTGKDLNGPQVSWNGAEGPSGGGGPFPIDPIPPYWAGYKTNKPLELPIQARSITGIILY